MTKYIIGEIFSSGGATMYKNPSDQTVYFYLQLVVYFYLFSYLPYEWLVVQTTSSIIMASWIEKNDIVPRCFTVRSDKKCVT